MNIDEIVKKAIPKDICKVREGFYISASTPKIIWVNPAEILVSLGEEPTFDYVSELTSTLVDAYAKDDIQVLVIGDA
jgi:hypothetical protein